LSKRPLVRLWLPIALLLSLVFILVGCTPSDPLSTFDAAGPVSKNQLNLFWVIFWASAGVFVLVAGLLLYSVIRFRERPGGDLPAQVHGNRRLEILWTLVPALLLAAISVMTVRSIFELESPPSDPADRLRVEVIAHQWWFEAVYPDFNVTTAGEIHIPVGQDVSITLDSDDVIHSFWVPKLGGKKDIIPNKTNTTWFRADEAGVFFGQCAEFCGIAHALMRFRVVAEPREEFEQWVGSQQAAAAIPQGPAAQGQQVFNSKGCVVCHTVSGPDTAVVRDSRKAAFMSGQAMTHAPNLTHFANRETFAGGIEDSTEENLKEWLRDPEDVKPGNRMARLADAFNNPEMALTEEDISALVAYLRSLE
jgi:cytochrome c oxidase subunit 2